MKRLFTFLVDIPEDGDWDADDVREQIGNGTSDMYNDEPIDWDDEDDPHDDQGNRITPPGSHPKVRHGQCPVCGHYGKDCEGY